MPGTSSDAKSLLERTVVTVLKGAIAAAKWAGNDGKRTEASPAVGITLALKNESANLNGALIAKIAEVGTGSNFKSQWGRSTPLFLAEVAMSSSLDWRIGHVMDACKIPAMIKSGLDDGLQTVVWCRGQFMGIPDIQISNVDVGLVLCNNEQFVARVNMAEEGGGAAKRRRLDETANWAPQWMKRARAELAAECFQDDDHDRMRECDRLNQEAKTLSKLTKRCAWENETRHKDAISRVKLLKWIVKNTRRSINVPDSPNHRGRAINLGRAQRELSRLTSLHTAVPEFAAPQGALPPKSGQQVF